MMRRITVNEVKAAYEKTGLKPSRGTWATDNCACGLGVCAIAQSGMNGDDLCADTVFPTLGIKDWYGVGFIDGFDNRSQLTKFAEEKSKDLFTAGFEDGRAAALAIFGDQITTSGT
jgi:hypothetical protein